MSKTIDWSITYKKSGPKLLGVSRRYVKDITIAEDILQEAFIVAIQKQASYTGAGSLEGWLKRIVVNMSLNYLKNEQKIKQATNQIIDIEDPDDGFKDGSESRNLIYNVDFTREELLHCIDALPEHHKTVFNLYVIDGFSHIKIGEMLNISIGTSKSHLHRARIKVRDFLSEKAKYKEIDKSKKVIIALLLFFGFEEKLMADTFKSKFLNYEIQPKKIDCDFSHVTNRSNNKASQNLFNVLKYKILATVVTVPILIFGFLMNFEAWKPEKKKKLEESSIRPTLNSSSIDASMQQDTVTMLKQQITEDKKKDYENNKPANRSVKGNLNIRNIEKQLITNPDDTLHQPEKQQPKQVIIKKQIVKKDTVYVFK
ncbi:RNA polymerase sigma factor [Flavobacterium sp.]|uniref:RNA polymerase sigma factor n=1 Tax=Flavobacterium sp. TaxID=239 RepID=UPI00261B6565|nr:RNA polymerase sigma factor [Flavobacterium sp.]